MSVTMPYVIFLYVLSVVYSQQNFSSQHWGNGSTLVAHAISTRTRIDLHYSPKSPHQALFTLNYFNVSSQETTSGSDGEESLSFFNEETMNDAPSEQGDETFSFDENDSTFNEDNYSDDTTTLEILNETNDCCLQADDCTYVKQSLQKDIEEYIDRIEQLNNEISRLNTTIRVLEYDAELRNKELYEVKSPKYRSRRCYCRRRKGILRRGV
ncbi:hypothetical protein J6590_102609 [Homalodisca vitripennis]|nr:hypothetical protein J6590_102609 [Homalodisca vitripennis]